VVALESDLMLVSELFDSSIGDAGSAGPNDAGPAHTHTNRDPTLPVGRQAAPEREVVIGARSWLATGVVITPGVTIGEGVSIGANSVVTHDLPDRCIAVGAPARVISS
jgi:ankyrin